MTGIFEIAISDLQPSQLYINEDKLASVMLQIEQGGVGSLDPVPVKQLNGKVMLTDGHTRAFALHQLGHKIIRAEWETTEMSWLEYEVCVSWCDEEGIKEIADLESRIIDNDAYQILWLKRCADSRKKLGIPD